MITFGLNRPLFSFGLSYPGYFFVVIPPEEGERGLQVYKVYESNRFRAAELARRFVEKHSSAYIAVNSPTDSYIDYYFVYENIRNYIPTDNFLFLASETLKMRVSEFLREYSVKDYKLFTANESSRMFVAIERK